MSLALSLFLALLPAGSPETSVSACWDLLSRGDKAGTLVYVTPSTRNHFIRHREPALRSWKMLAVEYRDPDTAMVSVQIERTAPGMVAPAHTAPKKRVKRVYSSGGFFPLGQRKAEI